MFETYLGIPTWCSIKKSLSGPTMIESVYRAVRSRGQGDLILCK